MANNEAVKALIRVQAALHPAPKDAKNNFGKYADLTSVWDAIRAPLTDNGFCITQELEFSEAQGFFLRTVLRHESGESFSTICPVIGGNTAQSFGSALTYSRRYSICALVGVTADDDDGAAATTAQKAPAPKRTVVAALKTFLTGEDSGELVNSATVQKLAIRLKVLSADNEAAEDAFLSGVFGVHSKKDLTQKQALAVLDWSKPYKDSADLWQIYGAVKDEFARLSTEAAQ